MSSHVRTQCVGAGGFELAEQEAKSYARDGDEFSGFSQRFALPEPIAAHGAEVFSLLGESNLEPEEYIAALFDTGTEHEQDVSHGDGA
ncbi:MAG TPA: hypothetical protein VJ323_15735 [Bryobacteraceae bacterium]|nr:hypothetical protein [Bryobacteraceae bacterium]